MTTMFDMIRNIAIIQAAVVMLLLLSAYSLKIYQYINNGRTLKKTRNIQQLLLRQPAIHLTPALIAYYKKNMVIVLMIVMQWSRQSPAARWLSLREQFIGVVMLPTARTYAKSRNWERRYQACKLFNVPLVQHMQLPSADEPIIASLMADPVPIIAIHAALIAVQHTSEALINQVITIFASGRHVQQALCMALVSNTQLNPQLLPYVRQRLIEERDPYIRAFCYKMLQAMPQEQSPLPASFSDINAANLELRIAAMDYLSRPNFAAAPVLLACLQDPHWQIRARAAKLLAKTADLAFVAPLSARLHDTAWWVRMNAAQALIALGEPGIAMLQQQIAADDAFAYDIAQYNLIIQTWTCDD